MDYTIDDLPDPLHVAALAIRNWAAEEPLVRRVLLFGSRVSGISHHTGKLFEPNADLDVAVELAVSNDDLDLAYIDNAERWRTALKPHVPWPIHLELAHPSCPKAWAYLEKGRTIEICRQQ